MELIVGGAYQGKTDYARRLFPDISWADGEHCSFEELCQCQGILKFHRYLERRMAAESRWRIWRKFCIRRIRSW